MKARCCLSVFLLIICIFTFMPSDLMASGNDFGVIERFDSYVSESNRQIIGDGLRVSFETVSDTERITVEVDSYEKYSKQYISSLSCLEYKYEGSPGEPFTISSAGSFNGMHYDRIIVKRLADGSTVMISLFLKSTALYRYDDTGGNEKIILQYNTQYKEYLDRKLLEKQQNEALFLSTVPEWFQLSGPAGESAASSALSTKSRIYT